jgi:hypothetical protein
MSAIDDDDSAQDDTISKTGGKQRGKGREREEAQESWWAGRFSGEIGSGSRLWGGAHWTDRQVATHCFPLHQPSMAETQNGKVTATATHLYHGPATRLRC